jgi:hypothetical protein
MLRLIATEKTDLAQIREWMKKDSWHSHLPNQTAEELLTGTGLLCFCIQDDKGPVVFVRFDKDKDENLLGVSTQFAPESEVSKRRLIVGLTKILIPTIIRYGKKNKFDGAIYNSVSPKLIEFMSKFGFNPIGGNDYVLTFEV